MKTLLTPWGENLDRNAPLPDYPRPQLRREPWYNLNGLWHYTVRAGEEVRRSGEILVPFSPESILSGCNFQLKAEELLTYERSFTLPDSFEGKRVLLHFGAVDQSARVLLNGQTVGRHEGGYLPFTLDITSQLRKGENRLTVEVRDVTSGGVHAYGKQKYERGGIWYTAQSGIWQTVWLEAVPENYIRSLKITPSLPDRLTVTLDAPHFASGTLTVLDGDTPVAKGSFDADLSCALTLPNAKLWSPESPFLYDLCITFGDDRVQSYCGIREFSIVEHNGFRVLALNGKPYFQNGLLDQGYWSDGLYTPPSDEAMIHDIQTVKDLGFNMLRKHIKIEPLRWYYHCDRLGMLVWQDMVSGGERFSPLYMQILPFLGIHSKDAPSKHFGRENPAARTQFEQDMRETVHLLYNCVSISMWVPFNEGWGQFDALRITETLRTIDPTRPIDHASGWHDQGGGDLKSRHIYFRRVRLKNDHRRVLALTEFGGYSLPVAGHTATEKPFGYRVYKDRETWMAALEALYESEILPLLSSQGLSAAVYTQVSDVEDEINGLLTYDRRVCKPDSERLRKLNAKLHF